MCDGLQNIFLLRIPEEDGENRQKQGVLFFKQTQKFPFCVRPWLLLTDIELFRTGVDRYNGILMSFLLLVAETIINFFVKMFLIDSWYVFFWKICVITLIFICLCRLTFGSNIQF